MNRDCKGFEQESVHPIGVGGSIEPFDTAFSWGYADVIDAEGNGVVVIWGFALPFLPGTVARGRQGRPAIPSEEPSVCVAAYRSGNPAFYLLQRCPPVGVADPLDPGGVEVGGVQISFNEGLSIVLDCPMPGGPRLTGRLEMAGRTVRLPDGKASPHRWGPRLVGPATVSLANGSWSFAMEGAGYHDSNASARGLHALGIRRWVWARASGEDGDWVVYSLRGERAVDIGLFIDREGNVRQWTPRVREGTSRRARWGMTYPISLAVDEHRLDLGRIVDDGPFYLRMLSTLELEDGRRLHGVAEVVDVDRMDAGWTAPLTKMAVHDPRAESPFCALFNGPHRGGFLRMLRQWMGP